MRILAFETSAKSASVALLQDGLLLGEYYQNSGQTHSRTLTKMAEDLLRNCDLTPRDVDAVACAAGPGSFTGVRIGVAAAKGFAWAGEKPCYGVSTLEAMARNAAISDGVICAAMDARRSQVYTAVFQVENGTMTRLLDDSAISLDELADFLRNVKYPKLLVGDGAQLCYNELSERGLSLLLMPQHLRMQRAAGVALLAWDQYLAGKQPSGKDLTPNYLRLSQAERERQKQMKTD